MKKAEVENLKAEIAKAEIRNGDDGTRENIEHRTPNVEHPTLNSEL